MQRSFLSKNTFSYRFEQTVPVETVLNSVEFGNRVYGILTLTLTFQVRYLTMHVYFYHIRNVQLICSYWHNQTIKFDSL